ncbi:hypothetical protein ABFS82_11G034800 [Erythranthe guttata]
MHSWSENNSKKIYGFFSFSCCKGGETKKKEFLTEESEHTQAIVLVYTFVCMRVLTSFLSASLSLSLSLVFRPEFIHLFSYGFFCFFVFLFLFCLSNNIYLIR